MSKKLQTTTDYTLLTALKDAKPFFIVSTNDIDYFGKVIDKDEWEQEFSHIASFDKLQEAGIDTVNLTDLYFRTISNDAPGDISFLFDKEKIVLLKQHIAGLLKIIGIDSIESGEAFSNNMLALAKNFDDIYDKPAVRLSLPSLAQPDPQTTFAQFEIKDTYHLYIQPNAGGNKVSVFFDFGQFVENSYDYVYNIHLELEFSLLDLVKALF